MNNIKFKNRINLLIMRFIFIFQKDLFFISYFTIQNSEDLNNSFSIRFYLKKLTDFKLHVLIMLSPYFARSMSSARLNELFL